MNAVEFWNDAAMACNQRDFTPPKDAKPEQGGPTLSSRALAITHLAMYDAYFGATPGVGARPLYQAGLAYSVQSVDADQALGAAAHAALRTLYPRQSTELAQQWQQFIAGRPADRAAVNYGGAVTRRLLATRESDLKFASGTYLPSAEPFAHRADPLNPEQGFHGPLYGKVRPFGVGSRYTLNPPPGSGSTWSTDPTYLKAHKQVRDLGGAPGQVGLKRTPEQTVIGLFWAYDGAREIGTPPRLYNQITRAILQANPRTVADTLTLLTLVNCAMGDAGILAWREKYSHNVWRPVVGVREFDTCVGPAAVAGALSADGDPGWLPLGGARTNQEAGSTMPATFTPEFPAYPSGHATFGAAAFQVVRRFYGINGNAPDTLAFDFVSDELNGTAKGSNGAQRARHKRHFDSLSDAIKENGLSRVYLGVHWSFDAFGAADYADNIGGIPLGITIANDLADQALNAGGIRASTVPEDT